MESQTHPRSMRRKRSCEYKRKRTESASPSQKSWRIQTRDFRGHGNHGSVPDIQKHPITQEAEAVRKSKTEDIAGKFSESNQEADRSTAKILKNPSGKSERGASRFSTRPSRGISADFKIKNNSKQIHPRNFRKKIPLSPLEPSAPVYPESNCLLNALTAARFW